MVNRRPGNPYLTRAQGRICSGRESPAPDQRPAHDVFPLDFFAEVLWPGTIEDSYTWTFQMEPFQQASADELIEQANQMRENANNELGKIAVEILEEEQK